MNELKKVSITTEIPKEAQPILRMASDLSEVCKDNKIDYVVHGSLGAIGCLGGFYPLEDGSIKSPGDVDAWYDVTKSDDIYRELTKKGYKHRFLGNKRQIFPRPVERFSKHGKHIDLHGLQFDESGIKNTVRVPLPKVSTERRPLLNLVYPPEMALTQTYTIGDHQFEGIRREALYIRMLMNDRMVRSGRNTMVLEHLAAELNERTIDSILDERPGLYYKKIPVSTFSRRNKSFNFVALGVKIAKKI